MQFTPPPGPLHINSSMGARPAYLDLYHRLGQPLASAHPSSQLLHTPEQRDNLVSLGQV